ncbi:hypothetical protein POM88_026323 [Heracleum sosnowskyi]|uniref:Uncharacterized protein n=1 Tax=Heracleum sosnowskyi TaxID=360622 RepID=A0AAD8MP35_9APIA|nr:hypothetical protein POM88_026323 [Heracleum sosnowskyi]
MARGPGWSSFTAFLQISYLIAQPHRRPGPGIGSHGLSKGVSDQHCACNGSVDCEGHGGVVVDGGRTHNNLVLDSTALILVMLALTGLPFRPTLKRLLASPWFATANVAVRFFGKCCCVIFFNHLACAIAFVFTFPIGIITAITNKAPGLNIITEYIIGYIYPGYQVANMYVKVYGYINMSQEITFLQDFKLGKILPRTMFLAQVSSLSFLSFY